MEVGIHLAQKQGATVEIVDLNKLDLPMYNQDNEDPYPEAALRLKAKLSAADGILVACPEYNGFPPPVLLNAVTWVSRGPGDRHAFKGQNLTLTAL